MSLCRVHPPEVTSRSLNVNEDGGGVNDLNPFTWYANEVINMQIICKLNSSIHANYLLDMRTTLIDLFNRLKTLTLLLLCKLFWSQRAWRQNKYGGRGRIFKPNLNIRHFPIWRTRAFYIFKFFNTRYFLLHGWQGPNFKLT